MVNPMSKNRYMCPTPFPHTHTHTHTHTNVHTVRPAGSFGQFELTSGCGVDPSANYGITFEFSDDLGSNWQNVYSPCNPFTGCTGSAYVDCASLSLFLFVFVRAHISGVHVRV